MTRKMIVPLLFGVIGTAILISLGAWQLQRLAWKSEILDEIETRMKSVPVPWRMAIEPKVIQFQPVSASGRFTGEELHVLTSVPQVGPGYRVVSAFETDDGARILVDRGFIPAADKDALRPAVAVDMIGTVRFPEETDGFTPDPDTERNIWFARDAAAMSKALNTEYVFVVLTNSSETNPAVTPLPVTQTGIPNNHLQYVLTWFSLALVWAGMTVFLLWRIRARTL